MLPRLCPTCLMTYNRKRIKATNRARPLLMDFNKTYFRRDSAKSNKDVCPSWTIAFAQKTEAGMTELKYNWMNK